MNMQSSLAMANIKRIFEGEGGKILFKNLLDNQKKEISGMLQNFSNEMDKNLDKKIKQHLQDFSKELGVNIEKKIKEALQIFSNELDGKLDNIINKLKIQDKKIKKLEQNYNTLTSIKLKYYSEMIENLKDMKSNNMDKLP